MQKNKNPKSQKQKGISKQEMIIVKAPVDIILNEYNLIKEKKSKLSKNLRDAVLLKVKFYVSKGIIPPDPDNDKK